MTSGHVAGKYPVALCIRCGLAIYYRVTYRGNEVIERRFEHNGVLSEGDGEGAVSGRDVVPSQCHYFVSLLPEHQDQGGHQSILRGHVRVGEEDAELLDLLVGSFLPCGVSAMRSDLERG
jgi:hypothetical protein